MIRFLDSDQSAKIDSPLLSSLASFSTAICLGGNVRVGLEDNLYIGKGELAKSNAEPIAKMKRIAQELGRSVATPDEARQILGLSPRN